MADDVTGDAARALADALAALDVRGTVEARGRLALFVPAAAALALADPVLRRRVVALAADHGFSHLAVALDEAAN